MARTEESRSCEQMRSLWPDPPACGQEPGQQCLLRVAPAPRSPEESWGRGKGLGATRLLSPNLLIQFSFVSHQEGRAPSSAAVLGVGGALEA